MLETTMERTKKAVIVMKGLLVDTREVDEEGYAPGTPSSRSGTWGAKLSSGSSILEERVRDRALPCRYSRILSNGNSFRFDGMEEQWRSSPSFNGCCEFKVLWCSLSAIVFSTSASWRWK